MDRSNLADIQNVQRSKQGSKAKVMLWGEYAGSNGGQRRKTTAEIVEDPYYGGREGFKVVYEQCTRFTGNFLREVFPDVTSEL
jgi:low molecular weight phosphotyrosine protein phosphatase